MRRGCQDGHQAPRSGLVLIAPEQGAMLMAREPLPAAASMALSRDKRPPQRQNLLLLLPEYTVSTAITMFWLRPRRAMTSLFRL